MQTASWTEWLFMRQVGGLPIRDLVIRALVPAAIQLPVLIPVLFWLTGTADSSGDSSPLLRQLAGGREWGIVWTLFSVTIVVLIPAWQLWRGARQGVGALWLQPSTWSEIFDAVLLAVTSGGMAFGLSILLFGGSRSWNGEHGRTQRAPHRRWRPHFSLLVVLLIPGLFGNLTLGLLTSAVFQTPVLNWAYDSPAPLVLGQTLSLLPRVAIVTCCLSRLSTGTEAHVLTLVRQLSNSRGGARRFREIQWRIQGRLWIAIIVLACFWAYFEVVLPSLLAMPGLVPVGMVLYNSLHYGRISALARSSFWRWLCRSWRQRGFCWGGVSFPNRGGHETRPLAARPRPTGTGIETAAVRGGSVDSRGSDRGAGGIGGGQNVAAQFAGRVRATG